MRLTNTLRQAFVRAAMADVPTIDYNEQMQKIATADAVAQLPPKVRAVYNDKELRHFIKTQAVNIGDYQSMYVPTGLSRYEFKFSPETQAELKRLTVLKEAQEKTNNELKTKLTAVANAANTKKKLLEMVPEFEKYMPADEAEANKQLPVVANVLSDFVKAGWPKDLKKLTPEQKAAGTKVTQLRQS